MAHPHLHYHNRNPLQLLQFYLDERGLTCYFIKYLANYACYQMARSDDRRKLQQSYISMVTLKDIFFCTFTMRGKATKWSYTQCTIILHYYRVHIHTEYSTKAIRHFHNEVHVTCMENLINCPNNSKMVLARAFFNLGVQCNAQLGNRMQKVQRNSLAFRLLQ